MEKIETSITTLTETIGSIPVRITLESQDSGKTLVKFYSDGHFRFQVYDSGQLVGLLGHVVGSLITKQVDFATKKLTEQLDRALGNGEQKAIKAEPKVTTTAPNLYPDNGCINLPNHNTWDKLYTSSGLITNNPISPTPDRSDFTSPIKISHRDTNEVN